jgi:hypothetical protein
VSGVATPDTVSGRWRDDRQSGILATVCVKGTRGCIACWPEVRRDANGKGGHFGNRQPLPHAESAETVIFSYFTLVVCGSDSVAGEGGVEFG